MARERTMKRRQEKKSTVARSRKSVPLTRRTLAAATARPKKTGVDNAGALMSREALERDLATAEIKIKEMEKRLALVTDRIAWVADRLHSILDEKK
jgi:hypothetical protein